jgi:hypothetical protein
MDRFYVTKNGTFIKYCWSGIESTGLTMGGYFSVEW